jgi:peptidoglycan-N-acetylglucosamine deacetylase
MIRWTGLLAPLAALLALGSAPAAELSVTMDDFNLREATRLGPEARNERILAALGSKGIKAALFVVGEYIQSGADRALLRQWGARGHQVGNHTYSHPRFGSKTSVAGFTEEILRCEKVIRGFPGHEKIFRFPMLAEGDTAAQRDALRAWLAQHGYRNGHVTIDASDWYIDERMRKRLKADPQADLTRYRDYYLSHLWERAQYYDNLAQRVLGRTVKHTLLLHFNLLNALFLPDVIAMFESRGWKWIDAAAAFQDPVFRRSPDAMPSGQSLIWALAKETGKYDDELRYPGEDAEYEKRKLDELGL